MKSRSKLQSVMGRYFRQKNSGEVHRFIDYKQNGDMVSLKTDKETFEFGIFDTNVWLEGFEEVETVNDTVIVVSKKETLPSQAPIKSSFRGDTITQLRDVLMDNIKKVQESPEYIPQATTIANTVNSLVNLAKIEIQINEKS